MPGPASIPVLWAAAVLLQGLYIELCAILRSYTLLKEVVAVSVVMNLLNVAGNAILINGFFGRRSWASPARPFPRIFPRP